MKKIREFEYKAEEGKVFVHKTSGQRYGNGIYLGVSDSIENYNEEDMTEADMPKETELVEPFSPEPELEEQL